MKAVHMTAVGGPEVLKLVDVPVPEVSPGALRVRNRAIAINFHEINERRIDSGQNLPLVPGSDHAGEVEAVGEGVDDFEVGDRVLGMSMHGAYAECTVVAARLAVRIPDDISFEQAASCPVAGLTAHFLLSDLRVDAAMTVVVQAAAGSVGCFLGGLIQEVGAVSIGLVSTDEKVRVARQAGHTHLVNYRVEDAVARVRELTGGRGADVVYDSVGGPAFGRSFEMTAVDGTVVLYGRAAGDPDRDAILGTFLRSGRNLGFRTYFLGTTIQAHLDRIPEAYDRLFEGLRSGRVHLPIEKVPLAQAADAHARIEAQRTVGKVILTP